MAIIVGLGAASPVYPAQENGAQSAAEIARLLSIGPGHVVADIGAGNGEWTLDLAQRVGPEGRVFSNEINSAELTKLKEKIGRMGVRNVTTVLGSEKDTGLPADSCDAILLRLVYHHLANPLAMCNSLRNILRAGGRLMIIDFRPGHLGSVRGVPENRGGHGIRPELVVEELTGAGFELIEQVENWDHESDRYCLVFRRKPAI